MRGQATGRAVRVRRIAGALLLVAAVVNLASALTPPFRHRLQALSGDYPLALHEAATAFTAVTGIALLQLARGVRRGQRWAWAAALLVLTLSAAAHVLKGFDVEEATLALAAVGFLAVNGRHFRAPTDRPSLRRGTTTILLGALVAIVAGTIGVQISRHRTSWPDAVAAVTGRLIGNTDMSLGGGRFDTTITLTLAAVTIGLAVSFGWLLVRPVLGHGGGSVGITFADARDLVARHGGDTLSYFALRDDKHHVRVGDTLISYATRNGVCLVSPDPIGPASERETAWSAFRDHVTGQGWSVAVLGASEAWLPTYRASGMADRYIGDEAIVDVGTFSLDGGAMKGLRQAVNRVAKYGYTIEFHDPASIDPVLAEQLHRLMGESRRGQVERGFSMTLSRVFDRRDTGLLLAVCRGPEGEPAAFCQYVPAADIGGFSLDLMRRSEGEHPNGLTDFVVVRTIERLRAEGHRGLSLNFATMRAVLAGEMGDSMGRRVEKRVVQHLSDSMQIESLWRYNAKFQPAWRRRYLAYDSPEHLVAVGFAVAGAEQFWELPLVGRFLPAPAPVLASP
ncbi:MAG TPA: phosphatidylglycerol lysyltransferase domain-containing protein [Acidimicrobiales bacterium]